MINSQLGPQVTSRPIASLSMHEQSNTYARLSTAVRLVKWRSDIECGPLKSDVFAPMPSAWRSHKRRSLCVHVVVMTSLSSTEKQSYRKAIHVSHTWWYV